MDVSLCHISLLATGPLLGVSLQSVLLLLLLGTQTILVIAVFYGFRTLQAWLHQSTAHTIVQPQPPPNVTTTPTPAPVVLTPPVTTQVLDETHHPQPLLHDTLATPLATIRAQMEGIATQLQAWNQGLQALQEGQQQMLLQVQDQLEPVMQTERLLSERVAALTRQHQEMNQNLEKIHTLEEAMPEKTRRLLKRVMRPAYQMLQYSSRSTHQLLEQHLSQQSQERDLWRQIAGELGQRFRVVEELERTHRQQHQELARMTEALTDLAHRFTFRFPEIADTAVAQGPDALEVEIEELLETIDAPSEEELPSYADAQQTSAEDRNED